MLKLVAIDHKHVHQKSVGGLVIRRVAEVLVSC